MPCFSKKHKQIIYSQTDVVFLIPVFNCQSLIEKNWWNASDTMQTPSISYIFSHSRKQYMQKHYRKSTHTISEGFWKKKSFHHWNPVLFSLARKKVEMWKPLINAVSGRMRSSEKIFLINLCWKAIFHLLSKWIYHKIYWFCDKFIFLFKKTWTISNLWIIKKQIDF